MTEQNPLEGLKQVNTESKEIMVITNKLEEAGFTHMEINRSLKNTIALLKSFERPPYIIVTVQTLLGLLIARIIIDFPEWKFKMTFLLRSTIRNTTMLIRAKFEQG